MVGEFVVKQEGNKRLLIIDYKGASVSPDLAAYPQVMRDVIQKLQTNEADEVVLSEYYERIYNEEQTAMLRGIADLVTKLETETVWSPSHLGTNYSDKKTLSARHDVVLGIFNETLVDPFAAYMELIKILKEETAELHKTQEAGDEKGVEDVKVYIGTLQFMKNLFDLTSMIKRSKQYLAQLGKLPEGRAVYHSLFESAIKPSFIGSRIFFTGTETLELVDQYEVLSSKVYIYKHPEKIEYLYYINPPEYTLPPEKYFLLQKTKEVVAGHRPTSVGFMDMEQARKYFRKIYVATITDLANQNNINLSVEEKEELATIVSRYTIGYGILELLLSDRQLTDVYIDSPLGSKPIYLVHSKYGQCQTNIIFSEEEAKSTVSRFRALSGRPFDEAHPILDFDLADLQTRIAAIGKPLAVDGTAFALRLHKDTPWTLAQFVDFKMMPPLAAGILSFFVDAQASMLIVGSRGSGKTSMLQALMQEIPQNLRIIVQEDSVTGDSQIVVERNSRLERTTVGELIDGLISKGEKIDISGKEIVPVNSENVKVFSLNKQGKMQLTEVSQFTRHKVNKDIYEVKTRSGRCIKVTQDHSLFTIGVNGLETVKPTELQAGSFVAIPSKLPNSQQNIQTINVVDKLPSTAFVYMPFEGIDLVNLKEIAKKQGYSKTTPSAWKRSGLLPISIARELNLIERTTHFKIDNTSTPIPVEIKIDEQLATVAGLWLADGCYDGKYALILSVDDEESRTVVKNFAKQLGLKTRMHTDKVSLIISNTNLVFLFKEVLGLLGNSYTKKFPQWAFNLGRLELAGLLRGLYSGDGTVSANEIVYTSCSPNLIKDTQHALSTFEIIPRYHTVERDKTIHLRIGEVELQKKFQEINFLQSYKQTRLANLCARMSTHATTNVVPLPHKLLEILSGQVATFNRNDYISRGNKLGKQKLSSYLEQAQGSPGIEVIRKILNSEVYWDEVIEVKQALHTGTYVYDFSVPECENFVCENIIAHNTQELPIPQLKQLGFNVQRLKTRPPLGAQSEAEVSAEDALRTALRLGDSVLIVGEVRSGEAKALYEAMRVGAVGNVVMGTIHGESAYSIWDRVVNDLGVPTTSFKATDMTIVAAPIRFKGSLKRYRRLIEITEVKKNWNDDPGRENGFLNWMLFDANKDNLEFFKDEVKESEWIKKVMRNRGLKYEDVWNEIVTRAASKQYLIDVKNKHNIPKILEADNTIRAHTKLMILAEKHREEFGKLDHKQVLADWQEWVDSVLVKQVIGLKTLG